MKERYTKRDFKVGQKVYAECINVGGLSLLNTGDITEEVVTKVGNKYVGTNKRDYLIANGVEASDYSPNFVVWTDKNEAEAKVAKDKVFQKLVSEFRLGLGSLQGQKLYQLLTLEDLREIEQIIENRKKEQAND
jgi:hypothetical protein